MYGLTSTRRLPCVSNVNVYQFGRMLLSFVVLMVGCGISLNEYLLIAFLFTYHVVNGLI